MVESKVSSESSGFTRLPAITWIGKAQAVSACIPKASRVLARGTCVCHHGTLVHDLERGDGIRRPVRTTENKGEGWLRGPATSGTCSCGLERREVEALWRCDVNRFKRVRLSRS